MFLVTDENIDFLGAAYILYQLREDHLDETITVVFRVKVFALPGSLKVLA